MVRAGSTLALDKAKRTALRWTPLDAFQVFPALSALAEDCGFRAAMLGGTFTSGSGADLDLAMIALRGKAQFKKEFLDRFEGELIRYFHNPITGIEHVHVLRGERLYDFCFGVFWDPGRVKK